MKTFTLYPLLLVCVLLIAGCGEERDTDPGGGEAQPAASAPAAPAPSEPTDSGEPTGTPAILVLGNSIAAGYGVGEEQAFPAVLQQKIDSVGWSFEVVNAGLSGETSAGGLRRIDWLLRRPVDVLILELGGNDGLRGLPLAATEANLKGIIDKTRARYPEAAIVLAGMQIPPNLGQDYTRQFREMYPRIAEERNAVLIPFVLEGVGGVPALMQNDGIHPTAEGQRIVANNVWEVLQPVLASRVANRPADVIEAE